MIGVVQFMSRYTKKLVCVTLRSLGSVLVFFFGLCCKNGPILGHLDVMKRMVYLSKD